CINQHKIYSNPRINIKKIQYVKKIPISKRNSQNISNKLNSTLVVKINRGINDKQEKEKNLCGDKLPTAFVLYINSK
ncbi:hypothetical protein CPX84_26725, partial [Salmonella enterica subsp. enterica serovar Typhimurium]|nr:hypothetical protein [Salmonella enterica subsp. enterica serovar Typhimurium]